MKQAILTVCAIAVAAGILAATVLYSISVLRECERRILTGDLSGVQRTNLLQEK